MINTIALLGALATFITLFSTGMMFEYRRKTRDQRADLEARYWTCMEEIEGHKLGYTLGRIRQIEEERAHMKDLVELSHKGRMVNILKKAHMNITTRALGLGE